MKTLTLVIQLPEVSDDFDPLKIIDALQVKNLKNKLNTTVNYEWEY